ncbi:hypothetical protein [Streptomyces sp. NPDC057877]|uniref:hypothetical protein n=1 Tax=Streptomyces sp. NPDC057877 TaxID=3346269 RepID=UPI00369EEB2B
MSEHQQPPADGEAPKVYHPQAAETPSYDEYADPAAAHGWQNAYDQTHELPSIAAGEQLAPQAGEVPPAPAAVPARTDRPRTGHRARRKPSAWRTRRAAVAAGAVGAVSAAALIAGFSFSGSSTDGSEDRQDRTGVPSAGDTDTTRTSDPDASEDTGSRTPGASRSASPTKDEADTTASPSSGAAESTAPTTSGAPTSTAPAGEDGGPGNSDHKPGNGQGTTKGPK